MTVTDGGRRDFEERHPDALPEVDHVIAHDLCRCLTCLNWRNYEGSEQVCFYGIMVETGTGGHGPCIDPWGQGCVCTGTAADGECEGCWLWLK